MLEKRLESGIRRGSAINIIVENSIEIFILYFKGLWFEEALKVVKKYWKVRQNLVCMSCVGLGYDHFREYEERAIKYVICTGTHKAKNYRYEVSGYIVEIDKICTHVISWCADCGGNH